MNRGYRKIMVIYRGNLKALKESFDLAKREGTWMVVLIPVPAYEGEIMLTGIKNIEDVLRGISQKELEEIQNFVQNERVLAKLRIEPVENEEEILEIAKSENCDLIILEPEKPSLWKRLLHLKDRLIEKLVTQGSCPILILK
ncbi:MAG: universal stress protein [Caldimicrobium sp.]